MSSCHRCGTEVLWVSAEGERVALNKLPQMRPPARPEMPLYRLKSEELAQAEIVSQVDGTGYALHRETCPALAR